MFLEPKELVVDTAKGCSLMHALARADLKNLPFNVGLNPLHLIMFNEVPFLSHARL